MQKISETFCPAKWDDLYINLESNFAYGCCKALPVPINNDCKKTLDKQKENLLNNIQDPSCEYCWKLERNNLPSLRQIHLANFSRPYEDYLANCDPLEVEINLGNECNFQCIYCNPKFSSKWNADVLKKPYALFTDKFNYSYIPIKEIRDNIDTENVITTYAKNIKSIALLGGEPFYNKKFFKILDNLSVDTLRITTNLSAKIEDLKKFFSITKKFKSVILQISIDSTGDLAEFTRYGINYEDFLVKLKFVLDNCPANTKIFILSVMTSITIRDIKNIKKLILPLVQNNSVVWNLSYCTSPRFQSFDTLLDKFKQSAILELNELQIYNNIVGEDVVLSAIQISKFNKTLYMQLVHFLNEFSSRQKIKLPIELD